MPITRSIDEQLKALLEGINALKNGQEETRQEMQKGLEYMQKSQEETKERMEKGQEDLRNTLEKKIDSVVEKIALKVEERIVVVEQKVALKVEEKIVVVEEKMEKKVEGKIETIREELAGSFSLISQRVEDLEKKLLASGNATNENKFAPVSSVHVPSSALPLTSSPVSVKLSAYEEKTNWEVYKTQFSIISESNGRTEVVKACQLAESLRGEATKILQTLPDTERLSLNSLYYALNLRFGQKYSKDYARLQMKTRLQKTGKSLQEYASEVERLANLAFSDPQATVRENISLQYFVDSLKEGEIQKAVRMVDVQDLKSALLYALKLEAAPQDSSKDRHFIRGARMTADESCESRLLKEMEILKEEMQTIKAGISNQEKRNFRCWGCGGTGHLRRNCPRSRKDENAVSSSKQEN
ncbi:uncharacterized protein TNCV_4305081 [Trichonephila clavipes]|nr:uncharacterized protein TNCV_4305081 [Trichonephila clavipes]